MRDPDLKAKLVAIVDRLGNYYGGDATDSGYVHDTSADNVENAVYGIPENIRGPGVNMSDALREGPKFEGFTVAELPFEEFKKIQVEVEDDAEELERARTDLIALIEPFSPKYALVGGPEFDPEDIIGGFYYCLLVADGDQRFLVAFPAAW